MFAIVEVGSKQYKVEEGQIVQVEKMPGDKGDNVEFDCVVLLSDGEEVFAGNDVPQNAVVRAEILDQTRGPKLYVGKYKRRKGYRNKTGHRQYYTNIRITEIGK